jgi:hypothetical protein
MKLQGLLNNLFGLFLITIGGLGIGVSEIGSKFSSIGIALVVGIGWIMILIFVWLLKYQEKKYFVRVRPVVVLKMALVVLMPLTLSVGSSTIDDRIMIADRANPLLLAISVLTIFAGIWLCFHDDEIFEVLKLKLWEVLVEKISPGYYHDSLVVLEAIDIVLIFSDNEGKHRRSIKVTDLSGGYVPTTMVFLFDTHSLKQLNEIFVPRFYEKGDTAFLNPLEQIATAIERKILANLMSLIPT